MFQQITELQFETMKTIF